MPVQGASGGTLGLCTLRVVISVDDMMVALLTRIAVLIVSERFLTVSSRSCHYEEEYLKAKL